MANNRSKALQFLVDEFKRTGQTPAVKAACAKGMGFAAAQED